MHNALKVLAGITLLVGGVVLAQELPGYTRLWREAQLSTRGAPSNPVRADGGAPRSPAECMALADAGMLIDSQYAYRVSVCGPENSLLDGGTLQMWLLDADRCRWMRNPSADETVAAGGRRCQQFADRETGVSVGAMLPACNGVLMNNADGGGSVDDGGTLCDVQVKGFLLRGRGYGK